MMAERGQHYLDTVSRPPFSPAAAAHSQHSGGAPSGSNVTGVRVATAAAALTPSSKSTLQQSTLQQFFDAPPPPPVRPLRKRGDALPLGEGQEGVWVPTAAASLAASQEGLIL